MKIITDYHMHTELCQHASGKMEDFVKKANSLGFKEIGFSDHAPNQDGHDPVHRMAWNSFPDYVRMVQTLQDQFPGIIIKLGIEADIYTGFEKSMEYLLENYPIDYVIGSVHFLKGEPVFMYDDPGRSQEEKERFIHHYFDTLLVGLRSGLFDIVAHPDVIKWNYADWSSLILERSREVIQCVKKNGLAIEINTSGLRKKPQEMYPSNSIISLAQAAKIPIIIGSDAHKPEEVGSHFDFAETVLEKFHYQQLAELQCGLISFMPE